MQKKQEMEIQNKLISINPLFQKLLASSKLSIPDTIFSKKSIPFLLRTFTAQQNQEKAPQNDLKKVFQLLKYIPKGVLQHVHLICCQDRKFFEKHIFNDARVYVSKDFKNFRVGIIPEKQKQNWHRITSILSQISEEEKSKKIEQILRITMFTATQLQQCQNKDQNIWPLFQQKILAIIPLISAAHILKKYLSHIFLKFIYNGYQRIQFRGVPTKIVTFNEGGQIVSSCESYEEYFKVFDEAYQSVQKDFPFFTVGVIIFGLKMLDEETNFRNMSKMLENKWDKIIGVDFVQQQDLYASLHKFDPISDQLINKFCQLNLKKIYHAGQTKNKDNKNVEIALNSGSYRVGHGINIKDQPLVIERCASSNICFEHCPISNVFLGYYDNFRSAITPQLYKKGIAVTINPDDPGTFGYQDTTHDYLMACFSYNWNLTELYQIAVYSIRFSICNSDVKAEMMNLLMDQFLKWAQKLIVDQQK